MNASLAAQRRTLQVCGTNVNVEPSLTKASEEGDNGISRASSVSAKDKSNLGKRGKTGKQRRDDSDSFDSRHQYTPYWGPQQQTWVPQPQYMPPPNPQYGAQAPPGPAFPGQMGPVYTQQAPGYPAVPSMPQNQPYPQYSVPPVCSRKG